MHFAILIYDEPDSATLRDAHRTAHLDYLKEFDDQTLFAGPFTTDDESADLGSFRLIEFPDRAAAEKHIFQEPYVIAGIQKRWKIYRWTTSVPFTWRDCPRTEGHDQALFYGLDHAGGSAKRSEYRDARDAYFEEHSDKVMVRGPLLNDAGSESVGDTWLLDIPNLDAGRKFLEGDPFYESGLYRDVVFHRWRFGRVFDRFKG